MLFRFERNFHVEEKHIEKRKKKISAIPTEPQYINYDVLNMN